MVVRYVSPYYQLIVAHRPVQNIQSVALNQICIRTSKYQICPHKTEHHTHPHTHTHPPTHTPTPHTHTPTYTHRTLFLQWSKCIPINAEGTLKTFTAGSEDPLHFSFGNGLTYLFKRVKWNTFDHGQFEIKTFPIYVPP